MDSFKKWTEIIQDGWCNDKWAIHDGADSCYRSYMEGLWGGKQFCYNNCGLLIPEGSLGYGTDDVLGPAEDENPDGTCNWNALTTTGHFFIDYIPDVDESEWVGFFHCGIENEII